MPRLATLLVVLTMAAPASATQCRAVDGGTPALAAIDAETRLAWIDRRLADDAARTRIWAGIWGGTYGAITLVELGLALQPSIPTSDRAGDIVGATSSFIGAAAIVVVPQKIMGDQRWWRRHYAAHRGDDVCALLNTAELLLVRDAKSQEFGIGPLVHVGNFVINIAAGLVLGLGFDRWAAFAYTSLVGIAVGEVQVATMPTDAIEDLRLYRAGNLPSTKSRPRIGVALAPLMLHDGGGAAALLRW